MVTMAQRIEALRTEQNLSRPALAAALGLPRTAIEKFETGRQTPSKDQQEKLAGFFGVSVFYLRGESDDRTTQRTWMDMAYAQNDEPVPAYTPKKAKPAPQSTAPMPEGGTVFDAVLQSKGFQDLLRTAVLDALRSPEGQDLLTQAIRKELGRR
ncbi:MAG: helix-turn-helix transcriptional regulator [Oscillospiraceae bacterium]|nr:helix-turn-helix transcriptional regulator [Oscillospiraceae bacterium]